MKHLMDFYQSLNVTLCTLGLMLVLTGMVLAARIWIEWQIRNTREMAVRNEEGKKTPGAGRMGSAVVAAVFFTGLMVAVSTCWQRDMVRGMKEGKVLRYYEAQVLPEAVARIQSLNQAMDAAVERLEAHGETWTWMNPGTGAVAERAMSREQVIPREVLAQLERLRWQGYQLLPVAPLVWLALGWAILSVLRMTGSARRAAFGTSPEMGRRKEWMGMATAVFCWGLAGAGLMMAVEEDKRRDPIWKKARDNLDAAAIENQADRVHRAELEAITAKADALDGAKGFPVITEEQRHAFLVATLASPKGGVRVMAEKEGFVRQEKMAEVSLAWIRSVQVLVWEAGYGGGAPSGRGYPKKMDHRKRLAVVPPLLEALEETGIAPEARGARSQELNSDYADITVGNPAWREGF